MKKLMVILAALVTMSVTANAMSYAQAREQALFLTDKMAYELNLTQEQYDAAYEVNLDYLMSVNTYDDLYGSYWNWRNSDLRFILLDWQYRAYCAASYFYRPLYWTSGVWHFAIYGRYPHRTYYYFGRPDIYISYRGGHGWKHNGGHSWYKGRTFNHGGISNGNGMRDRFDRGDFNRNHNRGNGGNRIDRNNGRDNNRNGIVNNRDGKFSGLNGNGGNLHNRPNRESSTRRTVDSKFSADGANRFKKERDNFFSGNKKPDNTFTPARRFSEKTSEQTVRKSTSSDSKSSFSRSSSVSKQTNTLRRGSSGSSFNSSGRAGGSVSRSSGGGHGGGGRFGGRR